MPNDQARTVPTVDILPFSAILNRRQQAMSWNRWEMLGTLMDSFTLSDTKYLRKTDAGTWSAQSCSSRSRRKRSWTFGLESGWVSHIETMNLQEYRPINKVSRRTRKRYVLVWLNFVLRAQEIASRLTLPFSVLHCWSRVEPSDPTAGSFSTGPNLRPKSLPDETFKIPILQFQSKMLQLAKQILKFSPEVFPMNWAWLKTPFWSLLRPLHANAADSLCSSTFQGHRPIWRYLIRWT